jgi:hypothetical protein
MRLGFLEQLSPALPFKTHLRSIHDSAVSGCLQIRTDPSHGVLHARTSLCISTGRCVSLPLLSPAFASITRTRRAHDFPCLPSSPKVFNNIVWLWKLDARSKSWLDIFALFTLLSSSLPKHMAYPSIEIPTSCRSQNSCSPSYGFGTLAFVQNCSWTPSPSLNVLHLFRNTR